MRRFLIITMSAIAATTLFFVGDAVLHEVVAEKTAGPVYWEGAEELAKLGVNPNDRLAVFASEPFGEGGAFLVRLDRAQILVQSRDTSQWPTDAAVSSQVTEILARAGIKAAIWYGTPPVNSFIPWKRLGKTSYYAYLVSRGRLSP
jgi:hypothetical protein